MASAASSPITSRPPKVEFTNRFVQPPSQLYVFRDDQLFLRTHSQFALVDLFLRARLLTPDGEIVTLEYKHTTSATTRLPKLTTHDIAEGFLVGLAVIGDPATFARGDVWATVGITRGGGVPGSITQILAADYVEAVKGPSWPAGGVHSSVSGPGGINAVLQTDPAAGAEFSITIPNRARQRLVAGLFELVTDGTAANRRFTLEHTTVSGVLVRTLAVATQPASTTRTYSVGHWGDSAGLIGTTEMVNWPDHHLMIGSDFLRTVTTNLQAGDDYAAPQLLLEEWLEE